MMALISAPILCLVFLPFTLIIGIWVAISDMRAMKIPNRAVLGLVAVWVLVGLGMVVSLSQGLPGLTLTDWGIGTAIGIAVLVVLFLANMLNRHGALLSSCRPAAVDRTAGRLAFGGLCRSPRLARHPRRAPRDARLGQLDASQIPDGIGFGGNAELLPSDCADFVTFRR